VFLLVLLIISSFSIHDESKLETIEVYVTTLGVLEDEQNQAIFLETNYVIM
jgi:hypothetical protein